MPSLWKKQKGNRIPRPVDDVQSSFVVETGCTTSIVDLVVKKTSKKKYRLKRRSTIAPTPDQQSSSPVSDPYVCFSKLNETRWSNYDEKTREPTVQKNNSDFYVEEIVTKKNPNVELSHDCCIDDNGDEEIEENGGVFRPKNNMTWLSVVKGALVVLVALYTKRIVVGIIIGALLLMLLEYVGSLVFRLSTTCEESKRKLQDYSEWRLTVGEEGDGDKVLKGLVQSALRVSSKRAKGGENVVTPKRAIEQETGSSDVSKCGAFTLKGFPSKKIVEQEVGNIVVLKSATLNGIASKKIIEQEEGSNNVVVRSATLKGFGITSKKLIEQEDGSGIPPRGEFEFTTLNSCSGKEVSNKSGGEIEVLEQNFCAGPKSSTCCVPGGYCELGWRKEAIEGGGGENEGESFEMASKKKSKKKKKGKKFWKKFVARHIRKKRKYKLDTEQHQPGLAHRLPSLEEITSALEDEDDEEEMMVEGEGSSSSSSSSSDDDDDDDDYEEEEEEWLGRAEHFSISNQNCTKMLETSTYESVKSSENFEERGWNLKCVTLMGIALAGLVIGRLFALMLTVVSCVMFKMLRI